MNKEIEIPEGYRARIEGNKVIIEQKESDDERIRKNILILVKKHAVNHERCQMEAYLEKQKEQNLSHIEDIDYEENLDLAKNAIGMMRVGACYINNRSRNEVLDWLENVPKIIKQLMIKINDLEKQKEQKPAEIDEYKIIKKHITEDSLSSEVNKRLKECGWYVTYDKPAEWSEEDERNYEYLHQIICNYINNPQIEYKEREKASKVLIPFWERLKSLHHQPKQEWSEEDEKNIEKLGTHNEIVRKEKCSVCGGSGTMIIPDHYKDYHTNIVYDDMTERKCTNCGGTGYIEKHYNCGHCKPAEWSEEDKNILEDAITAVDLLGNDNEYSEKHPNLAKAFRVAKDWLKSLPERFNLQPKQEWSEEDENEYVHILKTLNLVAEEQETKGYNNLIGSVDWFKSLPERFNLQPKQEWDEEDEQCLLVCKNALSKYQRSDQWDANIISRWLENRLKSFRPQSKNELSEEDERLLNIIIDILDREEHNGHLTLGDLKACVKLLKSIHPQHITYALDAPLCYDNDLNPIYPPINHWKPSEKQMEVLYKYAEQNNYDGSVLTSLYNDLKKL